MLTIKERHKSQGFYIPNIQNKYSIVSGLGRAQKTFENQVREVKEKLGREMREMQEKHEKQVNILLKETQKNAEESNSLKNRLTQLAKRHSKSQ